MKPCPFCAKQETEILHVVQEDDDYWNAHCKVCHAIGPVMNTREGAEKAWDTRHYTGRRRTPEEFVEQFKKAFGVLPAVDDDKESKS